MSLTLLAAAPFPFLLLLGAGSDLARYLIPNRLSLGLIGAFPIAFLLSGLGWEALGGHVLAAAIALAVSFLLFCIGVWGAGDGKFLPAALLWVGPSAGAEAGALIALLGGLLSLAVLVAYHASRAWPMIGLWSQTLRKLSQSKKARVPYGVAIAGGALLAFPESDLFKALAGL